MNVKRVFFRLTLIICSLCKNNLKNMLVRLR
nr:MAG TPA: hypothetical protein [Caudoviricetes sp.]